MVRNCAQRGDEAPGYSPCACEGIHTLHPSTNSQPAHMPSGGNGKAVRNAHRRREDQGAGLPKAHLPRAAPEGVHHQPIHLRRRGALSASKLPLDFRYVSRLHVRQGSYAISYRLRAASDCARRDWVQLLSRQHLSVRHCGSGCKVSPRSMSAAGHMCAAAGPYHINVVKAGQSVPCHLTRMSRWLAASARASSSSTAISSRSWSGRLSHDVPAA